jgi:hypothetical protein
MYRLAIIATCAAGVDRPCGYDQAHLHLSESGPRAFVETSVCDNAIGDTGRHRDRRLLDGGAGCTTAVVDLREELELADAGGPGDSYFGVRVHRERHHAVDVGGGQARVVERIQHGLCGKPQFAAAGILREVGGADAGDCRLAGQLTLHQACPPMVSVAVAMT